MNAVYLHGFASSPASSKAAFLSRRFAETGVTLHTPDLNLPDFSTLTVTRMLEQTDALLARFDGPVMLVGSSLGAFVAIQAALRRPDRVSRLVLLAPALEFGAAPGPGTLEDWRTSGRLNVFHYAYGRMMPVHYDLYADARRYDASRADLRMPILIFQGLRDDVVDAAGVQAWARIRPNVTLRLIDDGHQLSASLEDIWEGIRDAVPLPRQP
jgi:pimeloyl-ACP methyl ester carboxylesterase